MSTRDDMPVDEAAPDAPPPGGSGGGAGGGGAGGGGAGGGGPRDPSDDDARAPLLPYLKILRRAIRSLRGFFAAHVIVVQHEAEQEFTRLLTGAVMVVGAGMFFLSSAMLFATTLVALMQRLTGLPWLESIALALACTLTIALVLLGIGFLKIRKPLMPDSRELIQKTLDGLTKG